MVCKTVIHQFKSGCRLHFFNKLQGINHLISSIAKESVKNDLSFFASAFPKYTPSAPYLYEFTKEDLCI
jgi:hypothetical protein